MSKKNHNVFYTLVFFGILFSPFGFGSSPNYLPSENPDNLRIIVTIFDEETKSNLGFSPLGIADFFVEPFYRLSTVEFTNPLDLQVAHATNHTNATYPIITRHATAEINQTDFHHFTGRFGLPEFILEPVTEEYIAFRSWEDQNIIQFESMQNSFVYDKNACALTHFAQGYIYPNSTGLIKSDTWVVKFSDLVTIPTTRENDPVGTDIIDLGVNVADADAFRSTLNVSVDEGDVINGTTFKFKTDDPEHIAGVGRAILYDQNLNFLVNSTEVSIGVDIGDVNYSFGFANYTVPANVTSISAALFFNDNNGKVVQSVTNNAGQTVYKDISNTYPIAPDPYVNDATYESNKAIWFEINLLELGAEDVWYDAPQNFLSCDVTVNKNVTAGDFELISTKVDGNGTFTVRYEKQFDDYLESFITYNNTNPNMNTTRIAFSNILSGSPEHMVIEMKQTVTENSTDYDILNSHPITTMTSVNSTIPATFGNTTYTEVNATMPYDIDYTMLNATTVHNATQSEDFRTQGFSWHFSNNQTKMINYDFKDGAEKIWNMRVSNMTNSTNLYIDFMRNATVVKYGESTEIDPTTGANPFNVRRMNCTASNCTTIIEDSVFAVFLGSFSRTKYPMAYYDISAIPANADVLEIRNNLTKAGSSCSFSSSSCLSSTTLFHGEDLRTAPLNFGFPNLFSCFFGGNNCGETFLLVRCQFSGLPCGGVRTHSAVSPFATAMENELLGGGASQIFSTVQIGHCRSGCGEFNFVSQSMNLVYSSNLALHELQVDWAVLEAAAPPQGLSCDIVGSDAVLDWIQGVDFGGAPFADGYQIQRDSGAGFTILVADTGTGATTFTDTTIVPLLTFTYKVAAITTFGVGEFSDEVSCGLPSVPSVPLSLGATNAALQVVALDWTVPAFDGNTPITGYEISRTRGSISAPSADWQWREHRGNNQAGFIDTPEQQLLNCVSTSPQFSAECEGVNTNVVQIVDRTEGGLAASETLGSDWLFFHSNIPAEIVNGRSLDVTWSGLFDIGSPSLHEIVVYDGNYEKASLVDFPDGNTPTSPRVNKGAGLLQTCLSGVFNFNLVTSNCVLDTTGSTTGEVTIFIQKIHNNGGSARLDINRVNIVGYNDWQFNFANTTVSQDLTGTNFDHGTASAGVSIFNQAIADGFIIIDPDTGNQNNEFLDSTVAVDTQYGYRIRAENAEGFSPISNVAVITTVGLPAPPTLTSAIPTSTSEITVTWTAPNVGASTILGYQIDRKLGVGGIFSTIQPNTGNEDTFFNDQLLAAGQQYCYQAKTITNIGTSSDFSNEVCATTFDQADPPENLLAVTQDGSSILVTWDTPLDDGGSAITGYKIERQKEAQAFQLLFEERQPESNRVLLDSNLEIGTLYSYRISAVTGFGQGETALTSATTDATPQAPPNVSCSPAGSTAINLSWDTPLTFSAPTGYQIDQKLVGGSFSTIEPDTGTPATSFIATGLVQEEDYVFRVLGHTAEGDTDFSEEITCSPLRAPDTPPANLQGDFSEVVPHQTVLGWDIPDTFGIPIIEFRVERDDGAGYNDIGTVSGSSFAFIDTELDNDVDQRYRVITVGSEGETVPSIAVPFDANQTSHWHYENTADDTGENKNTGTIIGNPNFNGTGHIGKGFIFDTDTHIEVDVTEESDYDFNFDDEFGITTYYNGTDSIGLPNTFGFVTATDGRVFNSAGNMIACNSQTTITKDSNPPNLRVGASNLNSFCIKNFAEIDISSISSPTNTVTGIAFRADVTGDTANTRSCTFSSLEVQPSIGAAFDVYTDIGNGTDFLTNVGNPICDDPAIANDVTINLGALAVANMQTAFNANQTWWGVGIQFTDQVRIVETDHLLQFADNSFELQINYTTPDPTETVLVAKSPTINGTGYKFYVDKDGLTNLKLTNTLTTNEIHVRDTTDVNDGTLHFLGFGYNGNQSASGVAFNIDGTPIIPNVVANTLSGSILNDDPLTIGGLQLGLHTLNGTLDETRVFGKGSLNEGQLDEVANDKLDTVAPINATFSLTGSTFANISGEVPTITMISGFPSPTIGLVDLKNFTVTSVNSATPTGVIDPITGQLQVQTLFNFMGSLSNYTADTTLTNIAEVFPLLSNFDLQSPIFLFDGDFFFQQARDPTFEILSFNFTQTSVPFDLSCNFKATLFGEGITLNFTDRFFVQTLVPVDDIVGDTNGELQDVVVACIDPNVPPIDPTAPSFGGSNALLSFVSFGDTTGIGNFLNFTQNFGDFFGASLPFLFIIILAAAFTGRSAPTGIVIIGLALGIMWAMGILTLDPFMWGVIVVLIILGLLGGKKFL